MGELFLRLIAWLLLLGSGLVVLALAGLLGLPRSEHLGETMFVIPWTEGRRFVQTSAAWAMGAAAASLMVTGLTVLGLQGALGRKLPALFPPAMVSPPQQRRRNRRPALLLGAGLFALAAVVAFRWAAG